MDQSLAEVLATHGRIILRCKECGDEIGGYNPDDSPLLNDIINEVEGSDHDCFYDDHLDLIKQSRLTGPPIPTGEL